MALRLHLAFSSIVVFLFLSRTIKAAQCCGWKGPGSDETSLWAARARLCNNVWGQERQANGFIAKADINSGASSMQYAFWAKDDGNRFGNCWAATQQIIEQCFRGNSGAGSWEWGGELYTMSATTSSQYKRDNISVEDLPTPPPSITGTVKQIELQNGTYNVLGRPVNIAITGIDLSKYSAHPTRAEGRLETNDGPVSNYTVIITGARCDWKSGHGKRGQTCRASGRYVMMEYGNWWPGYSLASARHECGLCTHAVGSSITTSESFSIGIGGDVKGKIASAAWSFGYGWERSYTQSTTRTCQWNEGGCHTIWREQPMAYQGGFVLDSWANNEWQVSIHIQWVHSDAPLKYDNLNCDRGCCSGAVVSQYGKWSFCQYASGKECWYGTCRNYDDNCRGVGWC